MIKVSRSIHKPEASSIYVLMTVMDYQDSLKRLRNLLNIGWMLCQRLKR